MEVTCAYVGSFNLSVLSSNSNKYALSSKAKHIKSFLLQSNTEW